MLGDVLSGLVGGLELHVQVVYGPLGLLTLQLETFSLLDFVLQVPLLINQLT